MSVHIEAHNLKGSVFVSCEENCLHYSFKTSELYCGRAGTAKENYMFKYLSKNICL